MTAALIVGVLAASTCIAEPAPAIRQRALSDATQEMIECAAYFGIVAQGLRRTSVGSTQDAAKRYEGFKEEALIYAVKMAQSIEQKTESMEARLRISIDSMLDEMGRDYTNGKNQLLDCELRDLKPIAQQQRFTRDQRRSNSAS